MLYFSQAVEGINNVTASYAHTKQNTEENNDNTVSYLLFGAVLVGIGYCFYSERQAAAKHRQLLADIAHQEALLLDEEAAYREEKQRARANLSGCTIG